MNFSNLRNKQRQIQKTLQSIPLPRHNYKIATEAAEPVEPPNRHPLLHDYQQPKPSRRYIHPKHLPTEQNHSVPKYRSLEIASRTRKVSQHKFQRQSSQFEPYISRPVRKKTSAQNIQPIAPMNNRGFLKSKRAKRRDTGESRTLAKEAISKGQYQLGLSLLLQSQQNSKCDIQFLQLKGVCLLRLQKYERALQVLSKVILYDRKNCRQAYIWCALCQNHLNHREQSLRYIEQCIRLFPEHFQGYYFKGKVLFRSKHFRSALQCFRKAISLNPQKLEINLHIAQCQQYLGQTEEALEVYQSFARPLQLKNVRYAARASRIMIRVGREEQGEQLLQRCAELCEKGHSVDTEEILIECTYLLALFYFKRGELEKALMRGQWVMNRGKSRWIEPSLKIMMAANIEKRDFYSALNVSERPQLLGCKINLGELGLFCEGVIMLMRKRALEGSQRLQQCAKALSSSGETDLNAPIQKVIHLYLFYAYSLLSKDSQALHELELQKQVGLPTLYIQSTQYNENITIGFIQYEAKQYQKACQFFNKAIQADASKSQPRLYLAVTLFNLAQQQQEYIIQLEEALNDCCAFLSESNGNFSAYAFYFRGLFRAWQGDWSSSVADLDNAIEKSEDNFSKFFYLRALSWACLQNFKQAISDASIALSIDSEDPQIYLLRARCLQIEGDPSQAFSDLQSFIGMSCFIKALRPEDKEVHKFAGHLLFENGAFEDALQAYSQGQVSTGDTEVFLTKSKTFFLLGKFTEAASEMLEAARSDFDNQSLHFDYQMIKWLGEILHPSVKDNSTDKYSFELCLLTQHLQALNQLYARRLREDRKLGKIFKAVEQQTFRGMIHFYLQEYEKASQCFQQAIDLKLAASIEPEGDFQQNEGQKKIFINQMEYNSALCYCMLRDYESAQKYLCSCQINQQLHTFEIYQELMGQVKGELEVKLGEDYPDLFSLRNKISRFLPSVQVPLSHKDKIVTRSMKICIPYPKVEPPDINPTFDKKLIETVSLNAMERRPEAPWILKENNTIKFTDKMEVFSKLSLGQSSIYNSRPTELAGDSDNDSFEFDLDIKKKLRLDAKVEERLNKMIKKK